MRPEAIDCGDFAQKRTQSQNVKAVIQDILGHGNDKSILPGQIEADAAKLSDKYGGLLFTAAEIDALSQIAEEARFEFDRTKIRAVEV